MKWKILIFIILLLTASSKRQNQKDWKKRRQECNNLEACKYDETENCINRCLSPNCYALIFGDDHPEQGELDKERTKSFNDCLKREDKEKRPRIHEDL